MAEDQPMPANQRRVRHGGLFRCCLGTIAESTTSSVPGTTLDCKYESAGNGNLIVGADGVWEWNRPKEVDRG